MVEVHWGLLREILKYETFPLQIHKTKMVRQWQCTCHGKYIPDIFKIFAKFFLLITHYLLSKSPSLSASFGLVYWFLYSRSLALWTWLSVLALYLLLSVCLQLPVLLSGSTLALDPWLPWLVRVVEQNVVGDNLEVLLGRWGGGALQYLYIVAFAAGPWIQFVFNH